jgi:hypothetical protein
MSHRKDANAQSTDRELLNETAKVIIDKRSCFDVSRLCVSAVRHGNFL